MTEERCTICDKTVRKTCDYLNEHKEKSLEDYVIPHYQITIKAKGSVKGQYMLAEEDKNYPGHLRVFVEKELSVNNDIFSYKDFDKVFCKDCFNKKQYAR